MNLIVSVHDRLSPPSPAELEARREDAHGLEIPRRHQVHRRYARPRLRGAALTGAFERRGTMRRATLSETPAA